MNDFKILPPSFRPNPLAPFCSKCVQKRIFALIDDLDLVPVNHAARDLYFLYLPIRERREVSAALCAALASRNHSRVRRYVSASYSGTLF